MDSVGTEDDSDLAFSDNIHLKKIGLFSAQVSGPGRGILAFPVLWLEFSQSRRSEGAGAGERGPGARPRGFLGLATLVLPARQWRAGARRRSVGCGAGKRASRRAVLPP